MDMWLDGVWCLTSLFMALAACTKIRDGSQSKGAFVVIVLCLAHVSAVLVGWEKLAYVVNIVMIVIGGLLIGLERHWKRQQCQEN